MTVYLDRKDLIALVEGVSPHYSVFEEPIVKQNGHYIGGHVEKWSWNISSELTEGQLWDLYKKCKDSWGVAI